MMANKENSAPTPRCGVSITEQLLLSYEDTRRLHPAHKLVRRQEDSVFVWEPLAAIVMG